MFNLIIQIFFIVVKGGTLVVAPASVMGQWEKEISSRVVRGLLYSVQHHGRRRAVIPHR
jgi:SNF2 family DNA or RNA helicase